MTLKNRPINQGHLQPVIPITPDSADPIRVEIESGVAGGNPISLGDSPSIDAFGRLRISNPVTLFDSKQIFDNQPLFWDDQEVSGGGTTSTHSTAKASTTIAVSLNTVGKRVRQTFMRFNYQPGKSQLVFATGTLDNSGGGSGITRGMGIYDDNNGIFFQDDEGIIKAVIRSSATGSVVNNKIPQLDWNMDKLDGNGQSGKTLDPTKSQIAIIDYEWLGVGRVRIGFVIDGIPVYVHEFLHANISAGVYMSTPNLPLRYEIENDGTGAASELEHICTTVISEGGENELGILRHAGTEGIHIDADVVNTVYATVGIRLKTTHLDATIKLISMSMLAETNGDYEWELYLNPTIADTFTYANETNSAVQIATGATANTITNGITVAGGVVKGGNNAGSVREELENAIRLGASITGTRDEFILGVRPFAANQDIQASLAWREIS